ncbi:hypothetical protein OJ252_2174 [Cryptosporidium canis]|uniref:Uncharacterized protein n=1 Tax=Cryptosporidium canis TaxID=195482 RepID=A0ABQ8P6D6_9CRYT|nr:hypothetical protein OJ252_2174 [Cryptosporidium canis]
MLEICFCSDDYGLLYNVLINIFPKIDLIDLTEIFNYLSVQLLRINLYSSCEQNDIIFKMVNILYLLMANTRSEYLLFNILYVAISQINFQRENIHIILSLNILSSIIYISNKVGLSNSLKDPTQMVKLLKFTLEHGGIHGLINGKFYRIFDLMFIAVTILLYKSKDILEFETLLEISELFLINFQNINVLTLITVLIYHIKGDLVEKDFFCCRSKFFLKEKFKINGIDEITNIEFNYLSSINYSIEDIYSEIRRLVIENYPEQYQNDFDPHIEIIQTYLISNIYNGLDDALNYLQISYFLENNFVVNIYDETFCFSVINAFLKWIFQYIKCRDSIYSKKIAEQTEKLVILNNKYKIRMFDSLFPIYEFILRQTKQINEINAVTDSIHYSIISFGNNKNTIPIIYNQLISVEKQPKTTILEKLYHLFLKGELPYSKLEELLINQIDSELSNTNYDLDRFQNGIKILFCIIRYKPDIVDEIIIEKIQKGLKSKNKDVVSYSLHCLIELCKFGIIDYDKCVGILLTIHSNILIIEMSLPDNIVPLKIIQSQNFGCSNEKYPIEILSSFLRFFGLYIDQRWPRESESYRTKVPNNLFYILSMLTKVIRSRSGIESVYCLHIFSRIILDFFYQHVSMEITLCNFISWCIESSFLKMISNFHDLFDAIEPFILILNNCENISFNTLQFFILNISSPLKSILDFESINGIFNSKKQTNSQQFGMYNINITCNTTEDDYCLSSSSIEAIKGDLSMSESIEIITNKLKSIKARATHNYCIQEILGLFLYKPKQVRIDVINDIDNINIEDFRTTTLKDLFRMIRNIKLMYCTTFQWQIIFQFIKILKEYFNQIEFIIMELIPKSKKNKSKFSIDDEAILIFFLLLSFLPSVSISNLIIDEYSGFIKKCTLIRDSERFLFEDLFIENQAILILLLSSLVILRYDLLGHLYECYISEVPYLEILPNKLLFTFINSNVIVNKYFSKKNGILQCFTENHKVNVKKDITVEVVEQMFYIHKEINIIDFISCLLKHIYQYSSSYMDTLNIYFKIAYNESSINIFTNNGAEKQLLDKIYVTSNVNIINSFAFGVFSFFDIAFDTFSEKDELLNNLLYLFNITMNNDIRDITNIVFRTASAMKLFQNKMLTIYEIFDFINRYFILNDDSFDHGVTQEINCQLNLIKAFCFTYVNYCLKQVTSMDNKAVLKSEQIFAIEEYANVNLNIIKYIISTTFYENSINENQAFIISCINLSRGYYWVPWISLLYNKSVNCFGILNELCGVIHKNQLSSIKKDNISVKGCDKYSNIDLLLQSCLNDPIKMSICILLLSFQTINLTTSLENKLNFHNKEKYFDINTLNKSSLFYVSIFKLVSYTSKLKNQIEQIQFSNEKVNLKDANFLKEIIMVGAIIELFESNKVSDKFINFDISNSIEIILLQIIIPLCNLILGKTDDESKQILEWFIVLITKFLISYLNSNGNFVPKVMEFGYLLIKVSMNNISCDLIVISFTRIIGVLIFTSDSNFSVIYEFIITVFDLLCEMDNWELQISALFVNLNSIFKCQASSKKPLVNTKIENVLIKSLGELSYKLHRFQSKTILNSFKLLINTIYNFLDSVNQKDIIMNLSKSVNPLLLETLILENKLSIKIIHEYYLNLEAQESSFEVVSLANFYYLYSLKSKLLESEILNFIYKDFLEFGNTSLKRILVTTLLLSLLLNSNSTHLITHDHFYYNKSLGCLDKYKQNSSDNWIDLSNFYILDLEENPKLRAWNELFMNDDGIVFLSKYYYSIKQRLFSVIDTNLFYDKGFISFSLYEYPIIFLNELDDHIIDTWRKSISNLVFYSNHSVISRSIHNSQQNHDYSHLLLTLHKLLFDLRNESLKVSCKQLKDILIIMIKQLTEIGQIKNSRTNQLSSKLIER